MTDIKQTAMGTQELWKAFRRDPIGVYTNEAARMVDSGIEDAPSVSRVLEELSPTEGKGPDAYERLLMEAGIRTKSDPQAGYWASRATEFYKNDESGTNYGRKALLAEFFCRKWRQISWQTPQERATFLSTDGIAGSWERPYAEAMGVRPSERIAPAIPLSELIAMTTPIDSDSYRTYYLTYDATALRQFRVGESAELPVAKLSGAENTIRLHKYGRALQASYEDLRRMRVDKLAYYIQWMAVQSEVDKVAAAMTVLINGDGNANSTPSTDNLTALDTGATAGTLSLKGWLSYKMQFPNPYMLTTTLMKENVALQVALLNTGSANVPLSNANLAGLGTNATPINSFADGVRYGWTTDAPTLKIVGFDRRLALERVTEIGSEISEMERYITNQTQILTFSEVEGYAVNDSNAVRLLDVNA